MIHYIYKVVNTKTQQYYIGQRTCYKFNSYIEDNYMGSGLWILEQSSKKCGSVYKKDLPEYFVKYLVEYCSFKEELNIREKDVIGDLWLTDILCMNRISGGGVVNLYKDENIYHWKHIDGREEYLTQNQMVNKYLLCKVGISSVVNKKVGSIKGWFIYKEVYDSKKKSYNESNIRKRDVNVYNWKHIDGREEYLTQYDFKLKYKDYSSKRISDVVNRQNREIDGWYLYDDMIKRKRFHSVDEFVYLWKHKNGMCENFTRIEMKKNYNQMTDSGISLLINGKIKSHKGWSII